MGGSSELSGNICTGELSPNDKSSFGTNQDEGEEEMNHAFSFSPGQMSQVYKKGMRKNFVFALKM